MMPAGRTCAATGDGKPSRNQRAGPLYYFILLPHVLLLATGGRVSQGPKGDMSIKLTPKMGIRGKGQ
jgi:hypothetical protein